MSALKQMTSSKNMVTAFDCVAAESVDLATVLGERDDTEPAAGGAVAIGAGTRRAVGSQPPDLHRRVPPVGNFDAAPITRLTSPYQRGSGGPDAVLALEDRHGSDP